jgi:hypothetical protein
VGQHTGTLTTRPLPYRCKHALQPEVREADREGKATGAEHRAFRRQSGHKHVPSFHGRLVTRAHANFTSMHLDGWGGAMCPWPKGSVAETDDCPQPKVKGPQQTPVTAIVVTCEQLQTASEPFAALGH